jgi:hypothetical protein
VLAPGREQLLDAVGAIRGNPLRRDEGLVARGHDAVVAVEDRPACRILDRRKLLERHEALPVVLRDPARDGNAPQGLVPGIADRKAHGCHESDVPLTIGEDDVLVRRVEVPQRLDEFRAVARAVHE